MRELVAQPSPPNLTKLLFKMLDKDNSKTLEKEEVCEFVKKLINIIVRNIKNSVHIVVKAASAVLGSQAATKAFEILDQDRDGKLSPEECSMNFAGPMLMAVQSMAVAAPLLNEVRAKDHEIAYLRAKLAALGADASDFTPLTLPEVEISKDEWEEFVFLHELGSEVFQQDGSLARSGVSKITYLLSRVFAKSLIKLTQIPMRESHDPESFFKAYKTMSTENLKEIQTLLAPLYKVMPKGDRVIAVMDKIHDKIQNGEFDKEIRDFTGGLFKVLDQDDDGKINPADFSIYTDLIFMPCPDDESAKKKFMAIFNNLDLAKSGTLSQDEISSFVAKIVKMFASALLLTLSFAEVSIGEQLDHEIRAMMDFYIAHAKETKFKEITTFDIGEFNAMITDPRWIPEYAKAQAPYMDPSYRYAKRQAKRGGQSGDCSESGTSYPA